MYPKYIIALFLFVSLLTSCKKATRLEIDVCFKSSIEIGDGEEFPKQLKVLLNYQPVEGDTIIFPFIKLVRLDFYPAKEEVVQIPHTKENRIRTFGGIIKGDNYQILKADWDEGLPLLKANKLLSEKSVAVPDHIKDRKYDAIFYPNEKEYLAENEFVDMQKLKDYLFEKLGRNGNNKFTILYANQPIFQPDTTNPFITQIHDKLMSIAECKSDIDKVYEERLKLANDFNMQYVDETTEIKQFTKEGFLIRSHIGEEARGYILRLAETNTCLTNLEIAELRQSTTGKIGLVKLKESHVQ